MKIKLLRDCHLGDGRSGVADDVFENVDEAAAKHLIKIKFAVAAPKEK